MNAIKYILFDLDNTIYPAAAAMGAEIGRLMNEYISRHYQIPLEQAQTMRDKLLQSYGSTLGGLVQAHGFQEAEDFVQQVHPEYVDQLLSPDLQVLTMLQSISLPKSVFTNSTREHALRVLNFYGAAACFENIFDIRFNRFRGKPHPDSYLRVLAALKLPPELILFIDDHPLYLRPFLELGGRVLLVSPHPVQDLPHIDSVKRVPAYLKQNLSF